MAKPIPNLRYREFDSNGDPLAGGKLYSYIAGTSTLLTTYTDSGGLTSNSNPVILDANGAADVWLGNRIYKFVLTDAADVQIFSKDNIDGTDSGSNSTVPWATHNVTDGQAAADLAAETVNFALYTQAIWDCEITRGTTVRTFGQVAIQNLNGTGRVVLGGMLTEELHGVTFSLTQAALVCTLRAALDVGAGNGTIKLSQRLVPV